MNAASILRSKTAAIVSAGFLGAGLLGGVAFAAVPATTDTAWTAAPNTATGAQTTDEKARAKLKAVLDALPRDKRVGLGAVDQKLARVETVDELVARLEPRLRRFGEDRLLLVPDCGFATFSDNPISAPDVAEGKLGALASARRVLLGRERKTS